VFGNLPALNVLGLSLGLRELVLALVVLVVIYIAFVLLRMQRLRRLEHVVAAPPTLEQESVPPDEPAAVDPRPNSYFDEPAAVAPRPPSPELPTADALFREVDMLRDEVDAIRGELAALRADMQQELAHLRATQSVSPIYGDAMQMAAAGYDASTIAERCGIARAEAELVVALARSQGQ
jgi:hypothetical protein